MSDLVVWSGGMDSTALLHWQAGVSSRDYPVRAITVEEHLYINRYQLKAQAQAQKKYLAFAAKNGVWIKHERVCIKGNPTIDEGIGGQAYIWLSHIAPYIHKNDNVHFAYIKPDTFWHHKKEFLEAFDSLVKMLGVKAKVMFDFEWKTKVEIIEMFERKYKIPRSCYWSCEGTKNTKPCGTCNKCIELKNAREELKKKDRQAKEKNGRKRGKDGRP